MPLLPRTRARNGKKQQTCHQKRSQEFASSVVHQKFTRIVKSIVRIEPALVKCPNSEELTVATNPLKCSSYHATRSWFSAEERPATASKLGAGMAQSASIFSGAMPTRQLIS